VILKRHLILYLNLRAVVAKYQAGQKMAQVLKFYGKFESPIQSKFADKFSIQSDEWKLFLIGLERNFFFLSLPNNVRLTSKLYRVHKNKSSKRF
jgi:hypothetical protein